MKNPSQIAVLFIFFTSLSLNAQVTNNGTTLTVQSGLQIYTLNSVVNTGGGTINMNGGTLNVSGNWTNNATFNASSSTVNLYGGNQTIGGSILTTFNNLNLSGSGIKSLSSNAAVSGTLFLNDRELNTQGNTIFINSASTGAIAFTSGFVSSTSGGALSRNTNSTSAYVFPVGSSTGTPRYRYLEIIPSTSSSQTYNVRLANVDANIEGFNRASIAGTIGGLNAAYFHVINRTAGSGPTNVQFYYPTGDGPFAGIAHWNGSNWQEVTSYPEPVSSPYTRIIALELSSFSPFILFSSGEVMSIPTLSEWGLIILSLLTLALVAVFLGKKELSVAGMSRSPGFHNVIMSNVPFEKTGYLKILRISLPVALAGFALIHLFIGTNGVLDFVGTLVCTVIVSYLIHLYRKS